MKLTRWMVMSNQLLPPAAAALLLGVVINTTVESAWLMSLALFIICLNLFAYIFYNSTSNQGSVKSTLISKNIAVIVGLLIGLFLTINTQDTTFKPLIGQSVELIGTVVSDAEYRGSYQRFFLQPSSDTLKSKLPRILVTTDPYQGFSYGDWVKVDGVLEGIDNFTGESGREFAYREYLLVRNVAAQIRFATVSKETSRLNNRDFNLIVSLRTWLSDMKSRYLTVVNQALPEPHSSLAGGITVGANDALGEEYETLFRQVGLTHIIVLSGYNVAIIVTTLGMALAFLPYWVAAGISFIGIWLFVLLVGASTTIIRAGLMASAAVVSRLYGSQATGLSLLSLAVIAMVIHQPLIVVYDPSFQLSVLATLGIILVAPLIEDWFHWLPTLAGLREIVVTTIATQITVIPWIVYLMGDFSLVSPLANILVLPVIPAAMLSTFLIYIFSLLPLFGFGYLISLGSTAVSYYLLNYVFLVSSVLGNWTYSSLSLPPLSLWLVVLIYALIILILYKLHSSKKIS